MKQNKLIFIFFGPPGSGKGTQSVVLGQKLGLPVISTGELLRRQEAAKSPLGLKARRYTKRGQLVPDKLINQVISQRLAKRDTAKGFILDGYPRDAHQLDDLLALVQDKYTIWLIEVKVGDKEVINRISGRRVCKACGAGFHVLYKPPKQTGVCDVCGKKLSIREDDKPAVVRQRLADYKATAAPLLAYGKKHRTLISINGQQTIAKVRQDIFKVVDKIALHCHREEPR